MIKSSQEEHMTKSDFLDQLRTALKGELPETEIDSNMKFYDDYINTKLRETEETRIMEQLGNPRLIAKTIIETYQISHAPLYHNVKHNSAYQDVHATEESTYNDNFSSEGKKFAGQNIMGYSTLNWYQKLSFIIIIILIIIMLAIVGGILLRLFFSIGLPLIIIYLFYKVILNNSRK